MSKFTTALFLLLATAVKESRADCSFSRRFDGGTDLEATGKDESFDASAGSTTTCNVICLSGGETRLTLRYGGDVLLIGNDADQTDPDCNFAVTINSGDQESVLGWKIETSGTYDEVYLNCNCDNPVDQSGGWGCFSETTLVQVQDRGDVMMKDLQVGDSVMTAGGKYEPVYSFGHKHADEETTYYQIFTEDSTKKPLEMTAEHMIFVQKADSQTAVRADELQAGDDLIRTIDGVTGVSKVTKITTQDKKGMYMPLTPSGTILVENGILASTYVSIKSEAPAVIASMGKYFSVLASEHHLSHWWMAPYRMMCMGISSNFCEGANADANADIDIISWLTAGRSLANFADPFNFWIQVVVLGVPAFLVFAVLNLVEFLFWGPAVAPSAMMMMGLAAYYMHRRRVVNADAAPVKVKTV